VGESLAYDQKAGWHDLGLRRIAESKPVEVGELAITFPVYGSEPPKTTHTR